MTRALAGQWVYIFSTEEKTVFLTGPEAEGSLFLGSGVLFRWGLQMDEDVESASSPRASWNQQWVLRERNQYIGFL